jgi:hypothetical protein
MAERAVVPARIVASLREICLALPEVHEEDAWVGTRWCVRGKNFAHVVAIADGWPPAYARAAASDGPLTVLTFRVPADDIETFRHVGAPFFKPVWFDDIVGMILQDDIDWTEVAELVTDSYCVLAPKRLRDSVLGRE